VQPARRHRGGPEQLERPDVDCATGLGGGVLDIISIDASMAGKTLTMAARPFDTIWDPANPLQIVGPTTSARLHRQRQ
jgi:hypothetical protein